MDLIEYIRQFPDQVVDPAQFITLHEHQELCGLIQELIDQPNATVAFPTVFKELFQVVRQLTVLHVPRCTSSLQQ